MSGEDESQSDSESDPISDSSLELHSNHQLTHGQVSGPSKIGKRSFSITNSKGLHYGFMGIHKARARNLKEKARHLRRYYTNGYRELLNEEILKATKKTILDRGEIALDPEQIGMSTWSTNEKTRFFDSLARLGMHDLYGISVHIQTKSEPEVYAFIQLLQESLVDQAIEVNWKLLTQYELPAAVEIGAECCEALDCAAEALELFHRYNEEEDEEARRGDLWLLTKEEASWVGERVREGVSGLKVLEDKLPEATLLDLEGFLELSETIFMNSDPVSGKENWRSHAGDGETPSIRLAAFEDFYQLTVNITRRLVQAIIFHTLSRVRAMDSTTYRPKPEIRVGDVHAAVKSLGMKHDSRNFWKTAARRNGLLVTESNAVSKEQSDVLPYDTIEQRLSLDNEETKRKHAQEENLPFSLENMDLDRVPSTHSPNPAHGSQLSVSDSEYLTEPDVNDNKNPSATHSSSPTSSSSTNSPPTSPSEKDPEALEDAYVDALDRMASQAEEEHLWQILDQEPSNPQMKISLPAQPRFRRQPAHERKKWWEGFEYRPEWEVLASQKKHGAKNEENVEPAATRRIPRKEKGSVQRPIELDRDNDDDDDDDDDNDDDDDDDDEERVAEILIKRTQEEAAAAAADEDLYGISSDEVMQDAEGFEEE